MLTNLASYLLGYLGEPVVDRPTRVAEPTVDRPTRVAEPTVDRPTRSVEPVAPNRTHTDSDDDSWLLLDAGDENEELCGRLVRVSRSASTSSLPSQPLDESWFLTPPPCFTSTAPSGLEASPLENLLIEHPSMSVYHGRTRARSASPPHTSPLPPPAAHHRQPLAPVTDQQALRCLELRANTKYHKKQSMQVTRNQLDRSNKVREVNSRNRRQRRTDRQQQHSGVNNNRKCC